MAVNVTTITDVTKLLNDQVNLNTYIYSALRGNVILKLLNVNSRSVFYKRSHCLCWKLFTGLDSRMY